MTPIPRFRTKYEPVHCEPLAKLLNFGWPTNIIETYLGEPDCTGTNGGDRYGAERVYLASIGIPELRALHQNAESVYQQVTGDLIGKYVKLEKFPWLALLDRETAETQDITEVRNRYGIELLEIRNIYAAWNDLALAQTRKINTGPAVLTNNQDDEDKYHAQHFAKRRRRHHSGISD